MFSSDDTVFGADDECLPCILDSGPLIIADNGGHSSVVVLDATQSPSEAAQPSMGSAAAEPEITTGASSYDIEDAYAED